MVPLSGTTSVADPGSGSSADKEQKGDKEKGDKVARDRALQGQSSGTLHPCCAVQCGDFIFVLGVERVCIASTLPSSAPVCNLSLPV